MTTMWIVSIVAEMTHASCVAERRTRSAQVCTRTYLTHLLEASIVWIVGTISYKHTRALGAE